MKEVKLDWDNKECDSVGVETHICIWRGEGKKCTKPKNHIPYNYGYCPHQVWVKYLVGVK